MRPTWVLLALAACSATNKSPASADAPTYVPTDAPVGLVDAPVAIDSTTTTAYDFSCVGTAPATTASATIKLSGTAMVIDSANNALVTAPLATAITVHGQFGNPVTTAQPDSTGAFATTAITTGGNPLSFTMSANDPANAAMTFDPNHADGTDDSTIRLLGFTTAGKTAFDAAAYPMGGNYQSYMFACVTDCAGNPITGLGATAFTVQQFGNVTPDPKELSALLGSNYAGCYAIRLPQLGGVTISATVEMHAFPSVQIRNEFSSAYSTLLRPGA
jgi:hypothetical protein